MFEKFKELKKWQKAALLLGFIIVLGLMMNIGVDQITLND